LGGTGEGVIDLREKRRYHASRNWGLIWIGVTMEYIYHGTEYILLQCINMGQRRECIRLDYRIFCKQSDLNIYH
jgi:hypothetical protein